MCPRDAGVARGPSPPKGHPCPGSGDSAQHGDTSMGGPAVTQPDHAGPPTFQKFT